MFRLEMAPTLVAILVLFDFEAYVFILGGHLYELVLQERRFEIQKSKMAIHYPDRCAVESCCRQRTQSVGPKAAVFAFRTISDRFEFCFG